MARVRELKKREPPHTGLLNRARTLIERREIETRDVKPDVLEEVEFEERFSEIDDGDEGILNQDFKANPVLMLSQILAGIGSIQRGIEAPYLAFGILRDLLGISAGALLLPDHADETLVPFCCASYDFDTQQRLKITPSQLHALPWNGLIDVAEDVDKWRPFFSIRESEIFGTLFVIPCGSPEEGLVVISQSPLLNVPSSQLELLQTAIGSALGKMLLYNRGTMLVGIKPLFLISRPEFPAYLKKSMDNEKSLILGLPKVQLISAISNGAPGAIPGRLERDCLRVLGSIVHDEGAVSMDEQHFYVIFEDIAELDAQILMEQLEFSLQQAFSTQLPDLDFHRFTGEDLQNLGKKFRAS